MTCETPPVPVGHWITNLQSHDQYYYSVVQDDATLRWLVANAPPERFSDDENERYRTEAYNLGVQLILSMHDPDRPMVLDMDAGSIRHWVDCESARSIWEDLVE